MAKRLVVCPPNSRTANVERQGEDSGRNDGQHPCKASSISLSQEREREETGTVNHQSHSNETKDTLAHRTAILGGTNVFRDCSILRTTRKSDATKIHTDPSNIIERRPLQQYHDSGGSDSWLSCLDLQFPRAGCLVLFRDFFVSQSPASYRCRVPHVIVGPRILDQTRD